MKIPTNVSFTFRRLLVGSVLLSAASIAARADVITDWNSAFENSLSIPAERGPRVPIRTLAIMHASMFDAVNGLQHRYEPYHVTSVAPPGARAEAAAIQAAYTVLSALLPAHQAAYDAQLAASLAAIPGIEGKSQSIARGRAWGEFVAKEILAWRASDGFTTVLPPFVGPTDAGYWRHAPLGAAPNAAFVYTVTTPFVVADPMSFDPGPPYGFANRAAALASAAYAADVNETKARGGAVSVVRTDEETASALYLHAADYASLNHLLRSLVSPNAQLVDNARAFAVFNFTAFDATVVFVRLKYKYSLWRPFQAINYADEDNNPATVKDATWVPFVQPTPSHPEYPSAHVLLFTSLVRVAARLAGDNGPVVLTAPGFTETRTFASLSAISDASIEARINIGYHFRESCEIGQVIGNALGDYEFEHALQPLRR